MQIDPDVGPRDDLLHEQMREPCGKRSARGAGKRSIQIPAIRQVARMIEKTERVDNRHREQCAFQLGQIGRAQHAADDFDADDLVAMHRRADEQGGAWTGPVHDVH